jgi:hypothetical protein
VSIVAIEVELDDQTALPVRSFVLESVYDPVALNCRVVPNVIDGFAGLSVIETSAAWDTVSVVDPDTEPEVVVIVVAPVDSLVASP